MKTSLSLFAGLSLALFSCSGGDSANNSDSTASTAPEQETVATGGGGCCFTQESDFAPFIPAPNSEFIAKDASFASSFYCGSDEDNKRSSANMSYQMDTLVYSDPLNYKYLKLKIEDWCSKPDELKAKQERQKQGSLDYAKSSTNVTVADVNKAGIYSGYSVVDKTKGNNASSVIINVVVDNRFLVNITGIDHTDLAMATKLLDLIPTDKLAAAGK